MAGEEDVEFWQKLSKNTKSNTDNKTYKTSGCHNYPQSRFFFCVFLLPITKQAYDYQEKKAGTQNLDVYKYRSFYKEYKYKNNIEVQKSTYILSSCEIADVYKHLKFWHVDWKALTYTTFF